MSADTPAHFTNRYGRKPGRGIRPWILIPKVICVGLYLGALTSMLVVWWSSGFSSLAVDDPRRFWTIELISRLVLRLMVPALVGAMLFGVVLFLQHPGTFARLRWLQVKGISILIVIPSAHVLASSRLYMLRDATLSGTVNEPAERQFPLILLGVLIGSLWIVLLGRLKPRLGQNMARSFPAAKAKSEV